MVLGGPVGTVWRLLILHEIPGSFLCERDGARGYGGVVFTQHFSQAICGGLKEALAFIPFSFLLGCLLYKGIWQLEIDCLVQPSTSG